MNSTKVTPKLIKQLQKFEANKMRYMTEMDKEQEIKDQANQTKSFKYYLQHPNLRLLTACTVILLNIYLFVEDPIAHSVTECHIPLLGHIYSFIFANYPNNGFSALKTLLWMFAILFGIIVGKLLIHDYIFCKKLQLKIFSTDGQGSWVVMFLFTLCILYYDAIIYNSILTIDGSTMERYQLNGNMHIQNKNFTLVASLISWCGQFLTAWMIFDAMLQGQKYPFWMKTIKKWWMRNNNRVIMFWLVCVSLTALVVTGITTNIIKWDDINKGMVSTDELARSFLASAILCLDLVIIMQDWDFPYFCSVSHVKLPGINTHEIKFKLSFCYIQTRKVVITGKWFNYGFLLIVILLDMIRWRNQIWYLPQDYGQYVDNNGYIYTVTNKTILQEQNILTYNDRWLIGSGNNSNNVAGKNDYKLLTIFRGYHKTLTGLAFLPFLFTIFVFIYLIYKFSKDESDYEKVVRHWYESKFTKKRSQRRIHPFLEQIEDDSDSDDEIVYIQSTTKFKFSYFFQHPYIRLVIAFTGVILSWLLTAEDPIAHSIAPCKVDILGNSYSLVFEKYPSKLEFTLLKCFICLCALVSAIVVGKYMIHHLILVAILKLKLFSKGQGSWIITSLTLLISLYCWSLVFNEIINIHEELEQYKIDNKMDIMYKTFMKGVAIISFSSHFMLALMVTDAMLQENHYIEWAQWVRSKWKLKYLRVIVFWVLTFVTLIVVVVAITADLIRWDEMSDNSTASNELGRSMLAGFIILFDVLIIIQDWQFPRFVRNLAIKLPGLTFTDLKFNLCCIKFEAYGKWFTYSLLGVIFIIDFYNFKNQLWYQPLNYEQFINKNNEIMTILNKQLFLHGNKSKLVGNMRVYYHNSMKVNAKFNDYTMDEKGASFLPITLAATAFIAYGIKRSLELKAEKELQREMINETF